MPMDRGDSVVYADRIRIAVGIKIIFVSHLKISADSAFLQGSLHPTYFNPLSRDKISATV